LPVAPHPLHRASYIVSTRPPQHSVARQRRAPWGRQTPGAACVAPQHDPCRPGRSQRAWRGSPAGRVRRGVSWQHVCNVRLCASAATRIVYSAHGEPCVNWRVARASSAARMTGSRGYKYGMQRLQLSLLRLLFLALGQPGQAPPAGMNTCASAAVVHAPLWAPPGAAHADGTDAQATQRATLLKGAAWPGAPGTRECHGRHHAGGTGLTDGFPLALML
jgi:hypothetical protein